MEQNPFYLKFFVIPSEMFFDENLSHVDSFVFSVINMLDGIDNHCYASNGYLAKVLEVSRETISSSISRLVSNQYILKKIEGNKRILQVNKEGNKQGKVIKGFIQMDIEKQTQQQEKHVEGLSKWIRGVIHLDKYNKYIEKGNNSSKEELNENASIFVQPVVPSSELSIKGKLRRRVLTKAQLIKSAALVKRYQEEVVKQPRISPPVRDLLEYWISLNFKLPSENTKSFSECIKKVKGLLQGTLFNQKFSVEVIKESMNKFALCAFDDSFEPSNLAYKKLLQRMTVNSFIDNPFTTGEKSYFLKYIKEDPQPARIVEKPLEDRNPHLTKKVQRIYRKNVLSDSHIEFNVKERNCFVKASQRIVEFFKENRNKISSHVTLSDDEKAQYLWEAIVADTGEGAGNIRKITPGWFCSDVTFHHRYPAYLTQQGILFFEEEFDNLYSH